MLSRKSLAAAAAVALLSTLGLSACGASSSDPGSATTKSDSKSVDKELRAALPESVRSKGFVTVAVTPTYPPYEFLDKDGKTVIGQNADVLTALGKLFGIEFRYAKVNEFGSILSGIQAGRYDTGIIFGDTLEREKVVDILGFYNDGLSFVGGKDIPVADDSACGRTAGLGQGSTADLVKDEISKTVCTDKGKKPITFKPFANTDLAFVALTSGQIDLAFVSNGTVSSLVEKSGGKLRKTNTTLFAKTPTGMPFAKKNRKLADAIQGGMQKLVDDGTMLAILKEWKTDAEFSPKVGINLVGAE